MSDRSTRFEILSPISCCHEQLPCLMQFRASEVKCNNARTRCCYMITFAAHTPPPYAGAWARACKPKPENPTCMHHDNVLPLPAPTRKHVAYLYSFAFLRRIQFKGNRALKPLSETVSKRHVFHVSAWLKQP